MVKEKIVITCVGCGQELTAEHFENCDWVKCKCGHLRKDHDLPDGCGWSSGRGLRCPCGTFKPRTTYKEFYNLSKGAASCKWNDKEIKRAREITCTVIAKQAALILAEKCPTIPLVDRVYDNRVTDKVRRIEVLVSERQLSERIETFSSGFLQPAVDAFCVAMSKDKATGFLKLPALPPAFEKIYPRNTLLRYKNTYLWCVMYYSMENKGTLLDLEIAYSTGEEN